MVLDACFREQKSKEDLQYLGRELGEVAVIIDGRCETRSTS